MTEEINHETTNPHGDELLRILAALANPHRLRILAALAEGREYVSELARRMGISRPLLHMHLKRLEAAGLVAGDLELSKEGKAMKYYEATRFALILTPASVAEAARTLTDGRDDEPSEPTKEREEGR